MIVQVYKREGESPTSLLYRFTKKVQHSGLIKEVRGRRFLKRPENRNKRRLSALHRETKRREIQHAKKMGII